MLFYVLCKLLPVSLRIDSWRLQLEHGGGLEGITFPKQLNPKGGGGGYLPGFETLSALIKLIT